MKRVLVALAAAVVVAGGALGVFAYDRWQQSEDVRGSSTEEFVPTEPAHRHEPRDQVRWETYGFDAQRRRYDEGLGLRPPFRAVWIHRAKSLLEFPPVLAYGRLYVETNEGRLVALDARRGSAVWSSPTGRCAASSPAVSSFTVFAVFLNRPPCNATTEDLDGVLLALRARDGKERWRFALGPSETSPLVVDGRVYVGDWRGRIYSLDARTGRLLWTFRTGGEVKGALAYADGKVYAGSYDHHVYALDARTGRQVWRAAAQQRLGPRGTFYSTPAVSYGRVYIGSTDRKVYSFGAATGKLRWSNGTGDYVYASPAVWSQLVLVGSHDEHFYAFDAATGEERWKFDAKGRISGSATVLDGIVYFSTLNQRTYALDARTGRELWRWNDGKYAGVIGGRKRLFLVGHTRIYAMIPRPATK
ncbi:MAG: PQQ-binding-like beta-propeller repeat protein [Gaiellaceae bacterium]